MISVCKLQSFISIFSAPFGPNRKISVPIIMRISKIFGNNPIVVLKGVKVKIMSGEVCSGGLYIYITCIACSSSLPLVSRCLLATMTPGGVSVSGGKSVVPSNYGNFGNKRNKIQKQTSNN